MLVHKQKCRVCGNTDLKEVIDLGEQYFQGCFVKDGIQPPPRRPMPNVIVRCCPENYEDACGLVQTLHSIDTDLLYCNYWYESGISQTMRDHLKSIVDTALDITGSTSGKVLDIASNDNTLLRNYPKEFTKIGIDPSSIAARQTDKDIQVINTTFPSKQVNSLIEDGSADIVTSIACYYDIDDPVSFAKEIKKLLSSKGIWIFEVAYWKSLLDNLAYDSIVNEHIVHYHLQPLEAIMKEAGLKFFNVQKTPTNGGAIMCYITHEDNFEYDNRERKQNILNLKIEEYEAYLDTDKPYVEFRKKVEKHKEDLCRLVDDIVNKQNKTIHICGASTKLNTILNYCGIGPELIPYASERSPEKHGAETISGIKLISEEESRAMNPDYYLVGPYHFKDEIIKRETEFIQNGGGFIFPLPELTVVTKENI
jgi:hypothetical protein